MSDQQNKLEILYVGSADLIENLFFQPSTQLTRKIFDNFEFAQEYLSKTYSISNEQNSLLNLVVICELEKTITDSGITFITNLHENKMLKLVPLILISNKVTYEKLHYLHLLKIGVDDIYSRQVTWHEIEKRIQFLIKYKKEIIFLKEDYKFAHRHDDTFKISNAKRIFDVVISLLIILSFSPVYITIAILIKLESPKGPIIYRSKRVGANYQIFDFLKFRSMVIDFDKKLEKIAHLNQYRNSNQSKDAFIKLRDDPRVTRIGKFLRKTSLDELPQMFNVLRGDMSIVGNRPLPLYEANQMTKDYWAGRFLAPAGLTGLWQSHPEKEHLTHEERNELDLIYTYENSFKLDLIIIFKTLPAMIQKDL